MTLGAVIIVILSVTCWVGLRQLKRRSLTGNRYRRFEKTGQSQKSRQASQSSKKKSRTNSPSRFSFSGKKGASEFQEAQIPPQQTAHATSEEEAAFQSENEGNLKGTSDSTEIPAHLKQEETAAVCAPKLSEVQDSVPSSVSIPLIVFHLIAEADRPYSGYELLQAILSTGMRFGKNRIFHRHQEKTGQGPVLFSLASSFQPGIFDLSKMGAFSTPGLSLFFSANQVLCNAVTVYELMLQTVDQLVEDLGGQVLDESRQPLTVEKVLAQRELLSQFDRKTLLVNTTSSD